MTIAKDSTLLALTNDRVAAQRSRSAARAAVENTDAAQVTEQWTAVTAWAPGTAFTLGSGTGKVYGNAQGGNSGANTAFVLKATERGRAVFTVTATTGTARMIVGFSTDAAGASATASGATALGISFLSGTVRAWQGGYSGETTLGTYSTTQQWTVTLIADVGYGGATGRITATAVAADGTEYRYSWSRIGFGSFTVNNLFVFNSNAAGDVADYIGVLGARKGFATIAPRAGIEGNQRTVQWTTAADASHNARIAVPRGYDSRVPSPLIIAVHGHGTDEKMFADDTNGKAVGSALLDAGYIVASTVGTPSGTEFGNQSLQDAQAALYKYVRDHYNISSVSFYGISMGGLGSLNSVRDARIPGAKAWVGSSPICSLAYAYAQTSQGWNTEMETAYGIASGGSNYAAVTSGYDPLLAPSAFSGLPMFFIASPSDTTVTKTANSDALASAVVPYAREVKTYTASGAHNDVSQYPTSAIVAFFDKYAS